MMLVGTFKQPIKHLLSLSKKHDTMNGITICLVVMSSIVLLEKETAKLVTLTLRPQEIQCVDTATGEALRRYRYTQLGILEFCPFLYELLVETAPGKACHTYKVEVPSGTSDVKAASVWWDKLVKYQRKKYLN